MSDKMNIEELARQAENIADAITQVPRVKHFHWNQARYEAFASLVLEQAARKCEKSFSKYNAAQAIRAMKPYTTDEPRTGVGSI